MRSKTGKEKKPTAKTNAAPGKEVPKKLSSKIKKENEVDPDDDGLEDVDPEELHETRKGKAAVSPKKAKGGDDDEDDVAEEAPDEWEKPVEEENWDPDFEEFDIPKSTAKKSGPGKKGVEEDDFKFEDDEFKDLFNDKTYDDDEEEDY